MPDLVNPDAGILIPPRDAKALAAALEQALCREWDRPGISSHFGKSWQTVAEETSLCRSVLHGRNATPTAA